MLHLWHHQAPRVMSTSSQTNAPPGDTIQPQPVTFIQNLTTIGVTKVLVQETRALSHLTTMPSHYPLFPMQTKYSRPQSIFNMSSTMQDHQQHPINSLSLTTFVIFSSTPLMLCPHPSTKMKLHQTKPHFQSLQWCHTSFHPMMMRIQSPCLQQQHKMTFYLLHTDTTIAADQPTSSTPSTSFISHIRFTKNPPTGIPHYPHHTTNTDTPQPHQQVLLAPL